MLHYFIFFIRFKWIRTWRMLFAVIVTFVRDRIIVVIWIVSNTTAVHVGIVSTPWIPYAITNQSCEIAEAHRIIE